MTNLHFNQMVKTLKPHIQILYTNTQQQTETSLIE